MSATEKVRREIDDMVFGNRQATEIIMSFAGEDGDIDLFVRYALKYAERNKTEFARELGLSRQQVHRLINGESEPSWSTIKKMGDVFGVKFKAVAIDPELLNSA